MPDTNPSVFIAPETAVSSVTKKPNRRLLILVVAVIALALVGFLVSKFVSNQSSVTNSARKEKINLNPRIVLVADKKEYKVGEGVIVAVGVSTAGKKTDGTDLVLHYDNQRLTATTTGVLKGSIYPDYPVAVVDQQTGTIRISGIASVSQSFAGQGLLATILMTAQKPGQAKLEVEYTPGSTTDSNIVDSANTKDILGEVGNLSFDIK